MLKPTEAILQTPKPIDFDITPKKLNILHKIGLLKKSKRFVITPLTAGTLISVAENMIDIKQISKDSQINFDDILNNIVENSALMSKTLAIAIINEKPKKNKFLRFLQLMRTKRISNYIDNNLTPSELLIIINAMVRQMDITHFFQCIGSMKGLQIIDPTIPEEQKKEETSGK